MEGNLGFIYTEVKFKGNRSKVFMGVGEVTVGCPPKSVNTNSII